MNLKQIFCHHKNKTRVSKIFTGKTREDTGYTTLGLPIYCNFANYSVVEECTSCGKKFSRTIKHMVDVESASVLR